MSPTQRTLAECRRRGWTAAVVEKWNPHARIRQDLFGCIDVLVADPKARYILGIQACAGSSHSKRRGKILAEPRMRNWLLAGGELSIWSWSKTGGRNKRKTWTLREERFHVHGGEVRTLLRDVAFVAEAA